MKYKIDFCSCTKKIWLDLEMILPPHRMLLRKLKHQGYCVISSLIAAE